MFLATLEKILKNRGRQLSKNATDFCSTSFGTQMNFVEPQIVKPYSGISCHNISFKSYLQMFHT